jgi:micrococcal nuclease
MTAARAALADLLVGRNVELAFAERRSDRWGRLLAHVFIVGAAEREWVQGHLLRHGNARVDPVPDALACLSELLAHERAGMRADLGLWRNPAYRIRWADAPQRLMRLRNTFQLVEGRVRKVAVTRARVYLNFGDDWRTDFTAGASRRAPPFAGATLAALQRLEGRRVRVRGWIERRNGPYVEMFHPLQVEDIDAETLPPSSGIARGSPAPADGAPGTAAAPSAPGLPQGEPPNEKRPEHEVPGAIDL